MHNIKIGLLFLCCAFFVGCNVVYPLTKKQAIKYAKSITKKGGSYALENNKLVLKIFISDSSYQKLNLVYEYNKIGLQTNFTSYSFCDSCNKKYIAEVLNIKGYNWSKLNNTTYLSNYKSRTILTTDKPNFIYSLTRHNLNKVAYKNLLKTGK